MSPPQMTLLEFLSDRLTASGHEDVDYEQLLPSLGFDWQVLCEELPDGWTVDDFSQWRPNAPPRYVVAWTWWDADCRGAYFVRPLNALAELLLTPVGAMIDDNEFTTDAWLQPRVPKGWRVEFDGTSLLSLTSGGQVGESAAILGFCLSVAAPLRGDVRRVFRVLGQEMKPPDDELPTMASLVGMFKDSPIDIAGDWGESSAAEPPEETPPPLEQPGE